MKFHRNQNYSFCWVHKHVSAANIRSYRMANGNGKWFTAIIVFHSVALEPESDAYNHNWFIQFVLNAIAAR